MIQSSEILKARILIVDDEQANLALLTKMLCEAGYGSVDATTDPGQTCPRHIAHHYSLILLDLEMPGLDGFAVLEGIKAIESGGYLPVLVITSQPEHKLHALQAGARDFVSKPFDPGEVLMRVHNMLEVQLLQRQAESQKSEADAKLIEAQKMEIVGHLASGVAHDFNNLLSVILGYAYLLESASTADSPVQKYAQEIRHASEQAAGLTRQLLLFTRKETVKLGPLNLDKVIKDLDKMLRRLLGENITLTIVSGTPPNRVKADSGYLGQLIMNLTVNARDAMPNGGRLTITTREVLVEEENMLEHPDIPVGRHVVLSVADNGIGMTDAVKKHLFEAFFTTKPKGKGTGLGLATSQTIANLFGCRITVSSELGKGTTFNVYFPGLTEPRDGVPARRQPGTLPCGTETLLVIEDDPTLSHLACTILESHGYHVLKAATGAEAMSAARNHSGAAIGLVIADSIMPVTDGMGIAEWFKLTYPGVRILFTSGNTEEAMDRNTSADTSFARLPKPYEPDALVCKVREMFDAADKPRR